MEWENLYSWIEIAFKRKSSLTDSCLSGGSFLKLCPNLPVSGRKKERGLTMAAHRIGALSHSLSELKGRVTWCQWRTAYQPSSLDAKGDFLSYGGGKNVNWGSERGSWKLNSMTISYFSELSEFPVVIKLCWWSCFVWTSCVFFLLCLWRVNAAPSQTPPMSKAVTWEHQLTPVPSAIVTAELRTQRGKEPVPRGKVALSKN